MNFTLKYGFDPVTRQYLAEVPEFHIADFGDTLEDAEKNVKIALGLYFEELVDGVAKKTAVKRREYA